MFSSVNKPVDPSIHSINLCNTQSELSNVAKFLEVLIDKHISWKDHIALVTKKISKNIGIIGRLRSILPRRILITLYNTLILPFLSYCNIVWGSTYPSRLQPLFILQKRVIRYIFNTHYLYHTPPLFRKLNLLSIYDINRFQCGIFVYNSLNRNVPDIFCDYFKMCHEVNYYHTRSANRLTTPLYRLQSSLHCVRYVAPNVWNSLPLSVIQCSSLHTFKKKLKSFFTSSSLWHFICIKLWCSFSIWQWFACTSDLPLFYYMYCFACYRGYSRL